MRLVRAAVSAAVSAAEDILVVERGLVLVVDRSMFGTMSTISRQNAAVAPSWMENETGSKEGSVEVSWPVFSHGWESVWGPECHG